jgi:hypothetical protein
MDSTQLARATIEPNEMHVVRAIRLMLSPGADDIRVAGDLHDLGRGKT